MDELEKNYQKLLYWAKFACEEVEAFHELHDDIDPPTWLAELRSACDDVESEGGN